MAEGLSRITSPAARVLETSLGQMEKRHSIEPSENDEKPEKPGEIETSRRDAGASQRAAPALS